MKGEEFDKIASQICRFRQLDGGEKWLILF